MHGFEKEGIRITPEGLLPSTPHPAGLGSSLTHPFITTDFAEPQLELVTPPKDTLHLASRWLNQIQVYTAKALDGELMWPFSMPPRLPDKEDQIPVALFGTSSLGESKTIYRRGIGLRYGRRRQTLSGVHYNFSLDASPVVRELLDALGHDTADSLSDAYFHIVRNLYRRRSYFTYLFGATPAFDRSFNPDGMDQFKVHKDSTLYTPFATSLRISEIGYTSKVQDALPISYDSVEAYARDLASAKNTHNPDYQALSDRKSDQLSTNYLQIENELYAQFRLQQQKEPGENLVDALRKRGPGHIEIRLLDIDPECPGGVDRHSIGFLHLAMLDSLAHPSPLLTATERQELRRAEQEVIWRGREKGLTTIIEGSPVSFHDSGKRYCEEMIPLAEKMDQDDDSDFYRESLSTQIEKWESPDLTPSGKLLADLLDNDKEFIELGLDRASRNAHYFNECEQDSEIQREIESQTHKSIRTQRELELEEDTRVT